MADLPMLFGVPMVLALLHDRKTQTRRLLNLKGATGPIVDFQKIGTDKATGRSVYEMKDGRGEHVYLPAGKHCVDAHFKPRVAVGDRLYVREAWQARVELDGVAPINIPKDADILPTAEAVAPFPNAVWGKLRPAMHQPRWMSRITLIIEDVRIERLKKITAEDAKAEGLMRIPWASDLAKEMGCNWGYDGDQRYASPISAYASLWNSINGDYSWDENPWVAVYTFRVVKDNIDRIGTMEK